MAAIEAGAIGRHIMAQLKMFCSRPTLAAQVGCALNTVPR
jgi:hypothetical protein